MDWATCDTLARPRDTLEPGEELADGEPGPDPGKAPLLAAVIMRDIIASIFHTRTQSKLF